MKLTREEYRDLIFALDALRYGWNKHAEEYAEGTEGHERTVKLYEKLSKIVESE